MPVPIVMKDLLVAAASNSPAGSDTVTTTTGPDEYLRALSSIVRCEQAQAADVASAATVDLGAITTGNYVVVTGVTTITSFGTVAAGISRNVTFSGILTITHNATSLILPGATNIVTAAGDSFVFVSLGSGNWRCTTSPGLKDLSVTTAKIVDLAVTNAKIATATIDLTTKVTGALPIANGGTNATTAAAALTALGAASLSLAQTFTGAQRGAVTVLTSGATVTPDLAVNNNFSLTLAVNATLANSSTTPVAGQSGIIAITQDATGSRTLAYGSQYKFVSGVAPVLTTGANLIDYLSYYIETATRVFISISKDIK